MDSPPQAPPSATEYLRLVGIAALIGIPAALAAALFLGLIHGLEDWLWDELPASLGYAAPPWFLVLGLPVLGALLVVLARAFLPGDGGHRPLEGLSTAPTPPSFVPGVVLAAVGTLAFGAVLGPEMPVIALGSAVGVMAHRIVRLGGQEGMVLSSAGAFSAISALFGGPLVAGMLLVESGLSAGSRLIPALLPGLVAAAIGYVIFVGFGDWGGLEAPGLIVPNLPPYEGLHPGDLSMGIAAGVASVLVLTGIRRLAVVIDGLQGRLGMPALLLAGGFAVGALALAARALGADSQDVLFSGQASIGVAVDATLDLGPPDPARGQGPGLRREPRVRLPRRADLPGDLHRRGPRVAARRGVRHVPDARRRDRGGGRDGRPDPLVALAAPAGLAARRADRDGHDPRRGPCLGHGVDRATALDRRGQATEPSSAA